MSTIWTAQDLAAYLKISVAWVYARTGKRALDPIPRCPGIGRVRFNKDSKEFQEWLSKHIGEVPNVDSH